MIIMPLSGLILACSTDIHEVGFECSAEFRRVEVAVAAAELVTSLEHPGGASAQHHRPIPPTPYVPGVLPADLGHGPSGNGRAEGPGQGGIAAMGTGSTGLARQDRLPCLGSRQSRAADDHETEKLSESARQRMA